LVSSKKSPPREFTRIPRVYCTIKEGACIETGVVEKMYDLEKGITETFIKKGFVESYVTLNPQVKQKAKTNL